MKDNEFNAEIKKAIEKAVDILHKGQLVAIPTETVYGLAADALNPEAVVRIFELKKRPRIDPIIVHCSSLEEVRSYVAHLPHEARILAENYWPGPLTLVLKKKDLIPDIVTAGLPFAGFRVPKHPLTLKLIEKFAKPLAAPSANRFGKISPTTAQAVYEEFDQLIPMILDGGPCQVGIESTVVSFAQNPPLLLRFGAISKEEIERKIGPVNVPSSDTGWNLAPGRFPKHYAPSTPLEIIHRLSDIPPHKRQNCALLYWGEEDSQGFKIARNLSPKRSFSEAAVNFFQMMRELDKSGVEKIYALLLPEKELGVAINDRLKKAAGL
ncbi:L-threonylcarbamoyladenylate synthase [Methylacidiphilum caldifontis]|uniref:Threonylcarbamoyl-AMP synthase n=1 Tax=Methylacidiphilum caldifontis TaxID=2795386 RepID=A0A4Y8PB28_9BACT|nr:L-threonylcarbamoyladenylate synthase [Methylacidiphilum caldifontis]QSR88151.1 threonylcarbamoyl-AMP synthase [Methylacidiphilum caldifontis]TFE68190.1 threonylcarbamoyl-AMP synthase [Methylacidiphilum caldifontis]